MKKILMTVGIVALLVVCWRWSAAIPQDLDPLKVAPDTHKLVFENRFVRVLEVHVPPGKTGEIVWSFNRAGTFEFACLIAGHYQAGMVGTIHVSA